MFTNNVKADGLSERLRGKILLQVESSGEAWYVNPDDLNRHSLGRPIDAFNVMRKLGLGVSNKDFDSFNNIAPKRLSGKILVKVEDNGEAYYVNPDDLKMYYLSRPADAFQIMRELGLGITNSNIEKINIKQEEYSNNNLVQPIKKIESEIQAINSNDNCGYENDNCDIKDGWYDTKDSADRILNPSLSKQKLSEARWMSPATYTCQDNNLCKMKKYYYRDYQCYKEECKYEITDTKDIIDSCTPCKINEKCLAIGSCIVDTEKVKTTPQKNPSLYNTPCEGIDMENFNSQDSTSDGDNQWYEKYQCEQYNKSIMKNEVTSNPLLYKEYKRVLKYLK